MKNWIPLSFVLMALALAVLPPPAHAQSQVAGDWQGVLSTGNTNLRLVLHIAAGEDGSLKATLDSLDQGANGIPVDTITFKDGKLNLSIEKIHATYAGTLAPLGSSIAGDWTQGTQMKLGFQKLLLQAVPVPLVPSDIDGKWSGTLDLGPSHPNMIFRIVNTRDGLNVTLESADQTAIPATSVSRNGDTVVFKFGSIHTVFQGQLNADRSVIDGKFIQGENPVPLVVKKITDQARLDHRRPQNPVEPYPYHQEDVTFSNKGAGATLAATLTIPSGKGPFPAVLLIPGSGPRDRNESLLGHKPFLVLSDYLTRHGIITLRADKRGIGKSTGDYANATTADFAADAQTAVEFLKSRSEVDAQHIGLIGHSEGGIVAPMVASGSPDVAFIVLLAGSGVPGDQIVVEQQRLVAQTTGLSDEEIAQSSTRERKLLDMVAKEKDNTILEKELREEMAGEIPPAQINAQIRALTSPWFRYFLAYDPTATLRKVSCPVLALGGEKDLQVPPRQNLPAIRKALEEGGNKHFEVVELPGLNHLFQTARNGSPAEYSEIEETMAPAAMDKIATWVLKQ